MRVLNFVRDGGVHLGILTEAGVLDVTAEAERCAGGSAGHGGSAGASGSTGAAARARLPATMEQLISRGPTGLDSLKDLLGRSRSPMLDERGLTYAPVVTNPEKILCIGLNYASHIQETGNRVPSPQYPEVFCVAGNALAAHRQQIRLVPGATSYDYEAELVIVIGKECSTVPEDRALEHVFGYTCGNDLSARDLQRRTTQWFLGKSLDAFAPVGPCIATADSIDPGNLSISMKRGGLVVQRSNTRHLIFNCAYLVSYLSQYMTLKPGDLIFTGTPSGCFTGKPKDQQDWIVAGETLTVTIEGIGELLNTTV